jgi:hypothetical protein
MTSKGTEKKMTLWDRCDQIIKLIDKTLSEVAVAQTAIPTLAVGRNGRPRPGRQETSPLADEGQPALAPTGATDRRSRTKADQPHGRASPHQYMGYLQAMNERNR